MADKTYKNLFDDGYTTYHDDGTKSTTYKNLFDDGARPSVTAKELTNSFYTTVNAIKNQIKEHYEGKLYDEKAKGFAWVMGQKAAE